MMIIWILLILHLLYVVIWYVLIRLKGLRAPAAMLPMVLLVPGFGAFCSWNQWKRTRDAARQGAQAEKALSMEKLEVDDVRYQKLFVENEDTQSMVPLEEAILMNDSHLRRELMIDVLGRDQRQYVNLLEKAQRNDDAEVTHYASTAMMELQRDYELQIQRREQRLKEEPDSLRRVEKLASAIYDYLGSGILEGSIRTIYADRLDELCGELLKGEEPRRQYWVWKTELCFERSAQSGELEQLLKQADHLWPDWEELPFYHLRWYQLHQDTAGMYRTLQELLRCEPSLSVHAKEQLHFWKLGLERMEHG